MLVFDFCEFEDDPTVTCSCCMFRQDCYPDDRDDPFDELEASDLDCYSDDDFDDDEHNQYLVYISSL